MSSESKPLVFNVIKKCKTTKARVSKMILPHGEVDTPVFMPVGTQVKYILVNLKNTKTKFWQLTCPYLQKQLFLGYIKRNAS